MSEVGGVVVVMSNVGRRCHRIDNGGGEVVVVVVALSTEVWWW